MPASYSQTSSTLKTASEEMTSFRGKELNTCDGGDTPEASCHSASRFTCGTLQQQSGSSMPGTNTKSGKSSNVATYERNASRYSFGTSCQQSVSYDDVHRKAGKTSDVVASDRNTSSSSAGTLCKQSGSSAYSKSGKTSDVAISDRNASSSSTGTLCHQNGSSVCRTKSGKTPNVATSDKTRLVKNSDVATSDRKNRNASSSSSGTLCQQSGSSVHKRTKSGKTSGHKTCSSNPGTLRDQDMTSNIPRTTRRAAHQSTIRGSRTASCQVHKVGPLQERKKQPGDSHQRSIPPQDSLEGNFHRALSLFHKPQVRI